MEYKSLIKQTVLDLDSEWFDKLKDFLLDKFLTLSFISNEDVTKEILAEKICDYFEKVQMKTGKFFDKLLILYMTNLDEIVGRRIAVPPRPRRGEDVAIEPSRARKYYDKALTYRTQKPNVRALTDYTRLMMCLYTAIIDNKYKEISNFNYSAACLDLEKITNSLETEPAAGVLSRGKYRFSIVDTYSTDAATFVLVSILLAQIKNDEVKGEF